MRDFVRKIGENNTAMWALLLGFALMIFGLNLGEPGLYSAQESRAAIVARNMLDSGNYLSVYIKGGHMTEKPIFCYWLYTLSCHFFGLDEIGVRLVSVAAAVASTVFATMLGIAIYGRRTGFLAGFVLASMFSFVNLARIARIDMVLCAFFAASMWFFYKGYVERKKGTWQLYIFYAVLSISVLVKGPVTVVLAGLIALCVAARERNWRALWEMKPISGLLIGSVMVLPWYVYESMRTQGEFALDFLWNQNVDRFLGLNTSYCEGKRKTFLFYIPNLFAGALPWSLFAPFALVSLFKGKRFKAMRHETWFLMFWVLAVFVFFSGSCIKRGDYILPLYPALAVLVARYVAWLDGFKMSVSRKHWLPVWGVVAALFVAVYALVFSGVLGRFALKASTGDLPFIGAGDGKSLKLLCDFAAPWPLLTFAIMASLLFFLFVCGKFFEKGGALEGFYMLLAAFLIGHSVFVMWLQPFTDQFRSLKDFAVASRKHVPMAETVCFYHVWLEENVFYMDRPYERAWESKEVYDFENGKLKYNYFVCPEDVYEKMEPAFKRDVRVLERTVDNHQTPMVLCGKAGDK